MSYSTNSSITDIDFDDVSSFSSIDSYKPEPFTGDLHSNGNMDTTLIKNDTIIRHDTRTTVGSAITNNTTTTATTNATTNATTAATATTPLNQEKSQKLNSKNSLNTLGKQSSYFIERAVTNNALGDNVETVESLAAKGLDGSQKIVPDINNPLTMTKTAEFPEEYTIETDTGLVKMKTIETLRRQTSRISTQRSLKSRTESMKSNKSSKSFASSLVDNPDDGHLTAAKLNRAVERNRKELEKMKKRKEQKGIKGFFSKIF
ncbi:uncharacterized protein PWA37_004810 [Arxiozyma heterogenica]|uniref:Uncharacterized protein n=1 Tax=Arxiozyma heterogenica TaxID=278026 RepID=A0AAN7WIL9_9SACH|nr:hypothetical protein RI543_001214 [Kazachstania heterogenica]